MVQEFDTRVIEVIDRTYNVKSVRFALPEPIEFIAGQYMLVTLNFQGKDLLHALSMSNSPSEIGYVEFTKKLSDSEFSHAISLLHLRDAAKVKLPLGQFTLQPDHKKIALIAGGIGITPIRSMIKFATDQKLTTDLVLFYSNHRPEDIVFRNDFEQMEQINSHLKVIHTITCPDELPDWSGRRGYVNEDLIKKELPDYQDYNIYLCGPPRMMEVMQSMLKEKLCLPAEKIIIEKFSGY